MQQTQTGSQNYFRGYYIVFSDHGSQLNKVLSWMFTRPGFGHCSIYMECDGKMINVDQNAYGVEVLLWDFNIETALKYFTQKKFTVIYLPTVRLFKVPRCRLGVLFPTCVSLCQNITGITFQAFTPYGYYKALKKQGYEEICNGRRT